MKAMRMHIIVNGLVTTMHIIILVDIISTHTLVKC